MNNVSLIKKMLESHGIAYSYAWTGYESVTLVSHPQLDFIKKAAQAKYDQFSQRYLSLDPTVTIETIGDCVYVVEQSYDFKGTRTERWIFTTLPVREQERPFDIDYIEWEDGYTSPLAVTGKAD